MNIYVSFFLFSLIILLYWVISELFTILFRFTGMPDDKARFQVTSLLTGCGFTTRESELLLTSQTRRRLARITMLFGYVFNITIVSAFINVFLSLKQAQVQHYVPSLLEPLAAVAIIFVFMRVPRVRSWGDNLLQSLADRIFRVEGTNSVLVLDYIAEGTIALVKLRQVPEAFRDKPLSETGLRTDTGILVMLLERPGEPAVPAGADTSFREGDKLTVYGDYAVICKTFDARRRLNEAD